VGTGKLARRDAPGNGWGLGIARASFWALMGVLAGRRQPVHGFSMEGDLLPRCPLDDGDLRTGRWSDGATCGWCARRSGPLAGRGDLRAAFAGRATCR
jgi:hypothetical protein